jgi:hypothetical protein
MKVANKSLDYVATSKYLETILTDQNCINEEIESKLNTGNVCYYSVQSLLTSCQVFRDVKFKLHKTTILPVVLYGCGTRFLKIRDENRPSVFEKRVLRRIFRRKKVEVTGEWRKFHSGELHNLFSSPDTISQIKSRRMRWAGHVARMEEGRKM